MDSDCLVKLTKAGAKGPVTGSMEVDIPGKVMSETVTQGKRHGYQDAVEIESNIKKNRLRVVSRTKEKRFPLASSEGEKQVLALFLRGGYDAVASDDQRFLKKLETQGIPYLTPTACILFLYQTGVQSREDVSRLLEQIKPFVSAEEFEMAIYHLEEQEE